MSIEPATAPHPLTLAAASPFRERLDALGVEWDAGQRAAIARLGAPAVHGFYLWGPVGRGKTVLAEQYLAALPAARTRRFHFHDFFRALQREIFGSGAGLGEAIRRVLDGAEAVLFDEFHVHDVADAVYLTAVLRWFLAHDVLLIATSNYRPADLLPDPLHHHRFLPAIAVIEAELDVVPLGDGRDHRTPTGAAAGFAAGSWAVAPTVPDPEGDVPLDPEGVPLRAVSVDGADAVFTFAALCEAPVGPQQYLWLADRFRCITVLGVPDPARIPREPLHRLALLVDVLHDRDVTLHVVAADAPERMGGAAHPPRDAARALSRLRLLRR